MLTVNFLQFLFNYIIAGFLIGVAIVKIGPNSDLGKALAFVK